MSHFKGISQNEDVWGERALRRKEVTGGEKIT
jgi:hypothetical protein